MIADYIKENEEPIAEDDFWEEVAADKRRREAMKTRRLAEDKKEDPDISDLDIIF
jgi:hypothetical protein